MSHLFSEFAQRKPLIVHISNPAKCTQCNAIARVDHACKEGRRIMAETADTYVHHDGYTKFVCHNCDEHMTCPCAKE